MLQGLLKKVTDGAKSLVGAGQKDTFQDSVEEFGNSHWADLKSAFITYHQIVWDALLKYSGVLWISWNNQSKIYEITAVEDEWTPQPEINRFSPTVDSMTSNFSKVPEIEAVPNDTSEMERLYPIAEIATKLAQYVVKVNALQQDYKGDEDKPGRAGILLTLAGTVFTRVTPKATQIGEKSVMALAPAVGVRCPACDVYQAFQQDQIPDMGALQACPQCGGPTEITETTQQVDTGQTEPVIEHSVEIEVGNPLYMLPRPGAKHMGDLRYGFWAERRSVEEVWERWQIEAEPDQAYLDGYSTSYENTLQYYYTGAASSTTRTKEECLVVELFIEPGKIRTIPDGVYAVMVNGAWKYVKRWSEEFPHEHPLTKANYKNQPMLFFGRTDAFDLSKIQKELNHYEAIIKLHGMTASMEPILQDENTQVDEITNRGDRVIKYRSLGPGSQPPKRLEHGTLDNGIYNQRDALKAEFENISGAVNVWKGQAPGSITAASAIAQLRGQAEQMFDTPSGNWSALWKETVRKSVVILQQTMDPLEIAAIIGEGRDSEIMAFKQADLGKTLSFVSTDHGLPRTRDERRQEMITLWDHGAIDPSDIHVKERIVELFGETGMMQSFNKDATRARMENAQIKDGTLTQPAVMVGIEDLAVHFAMHTDQIKSLDFDKWDETAKKTLIEHTLQTREAMMFEQGLGVEPGEGAAGGGGNPPTDPAAAPGGASGGPGQKQGAASAPTSGPAKNGDRRAVGNRKGRSTVPAANNKAPQVPTGPNGPGASQIPGGNR